VVEVDKMPAPFFRQAIATFIRIYGMGTEVVNIILKSGIISAGKVNTA
jgi:hypothetical protein